MLVRLLFIIFIIVAAAILWITPTISAYRREKAQQRTARTLREREKAIQQKHREATEILKQTEITLSERKQRRLNELTYNINDIRCNHPVPSKKWQDCKCLKQDVNQHLFHLIDKLESYHLSDKEMLLCISCLVYADMRSSQMATHIIYSSVGIRTLKQRTAAKLGTTAANLSDFLTALAISA